MPSNKCVTNNGTQPMGNCDDVQIAWHIVRPNGILLEIFALLQSLSSSSSKAIGKNCRFSDHLYIYIIFRWHGCCSISIWFGQCHCHFCWCRFFDTQVCLVAASMWSNLSVRFAAHSKSLIYKFSVCFFSISAVQGVRFRSHCWRWWWWCPCSCSCLFLILSSRSAAVVIVAAAAAVFSVLPSTECWLKAEARTNITFTYKTTCYTYIKSFIHHNHIEMRTLWFECTNSWNPIDHFKLKQT